MVPSKSNRPLAGWLPIAAAGLFILFSQAAGAKTFRNAYLSFELPNNRWSCVLEQTEFVCRSGDPNVDQREAIIILTAKEVGPTDSLPSYEQHLRTPRTIPSRTGQPLQSEIKKVEQRMIANHAWVDGMHLSSEVPNYYTRYLATTKDKIAILVTFSAHKLKYTNYSADFFRAIESLRVVATSSAMKPNIGSGATGADSGLLGPSTEGSYSSIESDMPPEEGSGSSGGPGATELLAGALIIGAVGFYLLMKRKGNP